MQEERAAYVQKHLHRAQTKAFLVLGRPALAALYLHLREVHGLDLRTQKKVKQFRYAQCLKFQIQGSEPMFIGLSPNWGVVGYHAGNTVNLKLWLYFCWTSVIIVMSRVYSLSLPKMTPDDTNGRVVHVIEDDSDGSYSTYSSYPSCSIYSICSTPGSR
jgi:hypothetical protein